MEKTFTYSLKLWYTCGFATPLIASVIDVAVEYGHYSIMNAITGFVLGLVLALYFTTPFCIGLIPIIWLLKKVKFSVTVVKIIITILSLIYSWFMIFHSKREILYIMEPKAFIVPLSLITVLLSCIWIYQLENLSLNESIGDVTSKVDKPE